MTPHEIAALAISLENQAATLRRRVRNHKALTIGMALDEVDAIAKQLDRCAKTCREYHAAMTPKEAA